MRLGPCLASLAVVIGLTTFTTAPSALGSSTESGSWDIDGDGQPDKVTLTRLNDTFPAKSRLSVASSRTGRTATLVVGSPKVASISLNLATATPVDGRPGNEILISGFRGSNTSFYVIVAMANGKLKLTMPPGPVQAEDERFLWFSTTALYGFSHYARKVTNGKVVLSDIRGSTRVNPSDDRPETLTIQQYQWTAGKWRRTKQQTFRFPYPKTIDNDFNFKPYGKFL